MKRRQKDPGCGDTLFVSNICLYHRASKAQLEQRAKSPIGRQVVRSQIIAVLSLPQLSSKPESFGHQSTQSIPLLWPDSVFSGALALRKSQSRITGLESSSDAVII